MAASFKPGSSLLTLSAIFLACCATAVDKCNEGQVEFLEGAFILFHNCVTIITTNAIYIVEIYFTRSLGALRAPTFSWGPFRPRLHPSRPSGAQAGTSACTTLHPLFFFFSFGCLYFLLVTCFFVVIICLFVWLVCLFSLLV